MSETWRPGLINDTIDLPVKVQFAQTGLAETLVARCLRCQRDVKRPAPGLLASLRAGRTGAEVVVGMAREMFNTHVRQFADCDPIAWYTPRSARENRFAQDYFARARAEWIRTEHIPWQSIPRPSQHRTWDRYDAGPRARPTPAPPSSAWRKLLLGDVPTVGLARPALLALAKSRYRAAMLDAHPDRGGSAERAVELNVAMAAAERELQERS